MEQASRPDAYRTDRLGAVWNQVGRAFVLSQVPDANVAIAVP